MIFLYDKGRSVLPIELWRLAEARFDVLSFRYFGLYMPLLAEAGGKIRSPYSNIKLNFCSLSGLLWMQLHVASKQT